MEKKLDGLQEFLDNEIEHVETQRGNSPTYLR